MLEAKNGVASVSGLYWPANGFMFSPNVLSLTMEWVQDAEDSPKALILTDWVRCGAGDRGVLVD